MPQRIALGFYALTGRIRFSLALRLQFDRACGPPPYKLLPNLLSR